MPATWKRVRLRHFLGMWALWGASWSDHCYLKVWLSERLISTKSWCQFCAGHYIVFAWVLMAAPKEMWLLLPALSRGLEGRNYCRLDSEAVLLCLSCVGWSFLCCNFVIFSVSNAAWKLSLELECSEFKPQLCHLPVVTILSKLASLGPPFLIWKMRWGAFQVVQW